MAVTQNTYTGDGSTVLFSFTFPYLETTDIKVSLDGSVTTAYTLANATTIQFNSAPTNGAAIRIYRETDDSALAATFYPGSAIRSADLNENFTQNLYVTQEAINYSVEAVVTADGAVTTANAATATAAGAVSTANTAIVDAAAAVATANTASTNASAATSTANTASTNASAAVSTANSAAADAATAISTANGAVTTANSAAADAATAISTANSAATDASTAIATANTAATNASNAVTTANSANSAASNAVTTATGAVTTANAADTKADQAIAAVSNAVLFTLIANVAAIPSSPSDGDAIEIANSTGLQNFTPLTGIPQGFTGSTLYSVRLVYSSSGSTWTWLNYFVNDPIQVFGTLNASIATKLPLAGGTMTGAIDMGSNLISNVTDPASAQDAATKAYVDTATTGLAATSYVDTAIATRVSKTATTGSAELPSGTTAERDASPAAGYIRFNTTEGAFEGYDGSTWGEIGGAAAPTIDAGNFATGGSLVSTSTTFDGGQF